MSATMSVREALRLALREELARDERVFVLGEEVGLFDGSYRVTAGLMDEFGEERVRDTPISEEGFVGAAIGAAMAGGRPVVEIMTVNFSLLALDQIVNNAAKIQYMFGGEAGCPLVVRTPGGGGSQLTAQHSQSFDAWFASWSMARAAKSPNISSTTGRIPVIAAPSATPVMPASEIGVSRTRSGPKRCSSPFVSL